jgi:hypothetical protein
MKQWSQLPSQWVKRGDIWALVPIAAKAGPSQVFWAAIPTVLPSNDMIGLMLVESKALRQMAILASVIGPFADQSANVGGDIGSH